MSYLAYLTTLGAAQIAQSQIDGTVAGWSTYAIGDGNGSDVVASASVTKMVNTVYSGSISTLKRDSDDTSLLIATVVIPATAGDFTVREIGLYNTDSELVVYASYPETYKSLDGGLTTMTIRIKVKVSEDANVTLSVDTDAYATLEYVADATVAAAQALAETHTFITDLASEDAAAFDGTQDVSQGVTGVLPVAHGGTGATSLDDVTVGAATEATHAASADEADTLTSVLPVSLGGTGQTDLESVSVGHATSADSATEATHAETADSVETADSLSTPRELITDLSSTSSASFDGTADVSIGVTGILPVEYGGTGATDLADVSVGYASEAGTASTAGTADALSYDIRTAQSYTTTETTYGDTELIISPVDDTDGTYWQVLTDYTQNDDGNWLDADGETVEISEYSADETYAYGDLVYLDGVVYECIRANGAGVYEETITEVATAIDADEMTDTGLYYVDSTQSNSNLPSDNGGYLEVYDDTEDAYIVQTFTDSTGVMYTRTAVISEEETEDDDGETVTEDVYTWTDWQSGGSASVTISYDSDTETLTIE